MPAIDFEDEIGVQVTLFCNPRASVDDIAHGRETHASFVEDHLETIFSPFSFQDFGDLGCTADTAGLFVKAKG